MASIGPRPETAVEAQDRKGPLCKTAILGAMEAAGMGRDEDVAGLVYTMLVGAAGANDYTYLLTGVEMALSDVVAMLLPTAAADVQPESAAAQLSEMLLPANRVFVFEDGFILVVPTGSDADDEDEDDRTGADNSADDEPFTVEPEDRETALGIVREAMAEGDIPDEGGLAEAVTDFLVETAVKTDMVLGEECREQLPVLRLIFPEGVERRPAGSYWERLDHILLITNDGDDDDEADDGGQGESFIFTVAPEGDWKVATLSIQDLTDED